MRKLLALLILLAAPAWAATYYVKNGGSDANSGLSDALAWETVNKVNTSSFSAGDSILFKKGCTWREQLTVPSSGSSGNPITFGVYSTGADPIISGATVVSSWTQVAGAYDWQFDNEEALPGDWTSETDASGNIDRVTDAVAVHEGSNGIAYEMSGDTTVRYLAKTGLSSSASWYFVLYFKLSSDFTLVDEKDFDFFRGLQSGSQVINVRFYRTGSTYRLLSTYFKPEFAGMTLTGTNISFNAWHKLKVYGTNLNTTGGAWYVYLDDVLEGSATGLNFTGAEGNIDEVRVGTVNLTVGANPGGYVYWDDGYFDQDDSPADSNQWYATLAGATAASIAWEGTTLLGDKKTALNQLVNYGDWWHDTANSLLYVYKTSEPSNIEAGQLSPIQIYGTDYVSIQALNLIRGQPSGVDIYAAVGANITACTLDSFSYHGIQYNASSTGTVAGCTISNPGLRMGDGAGVEIMNGSSVTVDGNEIFCTETFSAGNQDGVMVEKAGGSVAAAIVRNNKIHAMDNSGIVVYDNATGAVTILHNLVYENTWHGIQVNTNGDSSGVLISGNVIYGNGPVQLGRGIEVMANSDGVKVYGNTLYGNSIGIHIEDDCTGSNVRNNLSTGSTGYEFEIEAGGESGATVNYNNFYKPSGAIWKYNGTEYTVLATYRSASGFDANGLSADPLMTDPANDVFTLQAGSPCIEKGVNLGASYLEQLLAGSTWPAAVETMDWHKTGGAPDVGAYGYRKVIW